MNKTDSQLKQDIEDELRWDPKINAAQIGVSVDDGSVTLLGSVDNYAAKWAAEDATRRVSGVRTVAQDLKVKLADGHKRSDSEVASAVQTALRWDVFVPTTVTARIQDGAVTLEGHVSWNYQRDAAERAVRFLSGVCSVSNAITIQPEVSIGQVKEKVLAALQRQATSDAKTIHVETSGSKVTLSGHASSWRSLEDAAAAAWAAPGVTAVVNDMQVATSF